ncbi:universal stress protein [soil metagenome]
MNTTMEDRTLVVGIDEERPASLRYALVEADRLGCGVTVVHAYALPSSMPGVAYGQEVVDSFHDGAVALLASARAYVEEFDSDVPVAYDVHVGLASDVLTKLSTSARAIILGPDDTPWYDRLFTGSVAKALAQNALCPVIVVPEGWDADQRGSVVVALDGDTVAHGPLRYAFDAASKRKAILRALHIVPLATTPRDTEIHRATIESMIDKWALDYPDVTAWTEVEVGEIDDRTDAATRRAAIVVVGRPHHRRLSFAASRPAAIAVIREAQCPVAVVPPNYDG